MVGITRYGRRSVPAAAFIDSFGEETQRSFSVSPANREGPTKYIELPEGQVYGKYDVDGKLYPLAKDAADGAVSSSNDIKVGDIDQFFVGDWVELPTSVSSGADRFRKVTAIDEDTSTITVGGAAFSLADGDDIEVDPTRSFSSLNGAVSTSDTLTLPTGDGAKFEEGDLLDVGSSTGLTVTDVTGDTVTVDSTISESDGAQVVSNPDGGYHISPKYIRLVEIDGYEKPNPMGLMRRAGEVREDVLTGLTTRAKQALQPMIEFNKTL